MEAPTEPTSGGRARTIALATGAIATLLIPINFFVAVASLDEDDLVAVFMGLGALQLVLGVVSCVAAIVHVRALNQGKGVWIALAVFSGLVGLGGPVGVVLGVFAHVAAKRALVHEADPAALRRHGRIEDTEWAELWEARLDATRERAQTLLTVARAA